MADWTDIPDENLLPGRPARSVDAIALRDNVIAQAEGAAGAPKSQTNSYADRSITTQKIAPGAITEGELAGGSVTLSKLNPGTFSTAEIGTYALLYYAGTDNVNPGETRAGNLYPASAGGGFSGAFGGTWRCMGFSFHEPGNRDNSTTLWLRIS